MTIWVFWWVGLILIPDRYVFCFVFRSSSYLLLNVGLNQIQRFIFKFNLPAHTYFKNTGVFRYANSVPHWLQLEDTQKMIAKYRANWFHEMCKIHAHSLKCKIKLHIKWHKCRSCCICSVNKWKGNPRRIASKLYSSQEFIPNAK